MSQIEDVVVELPEQIKEITREEAEADPGLRADPSSAREGGLDDAIEPEVFEALELEAAEAALVVADDAGGGAAAPVSAHQQQMIALALTQKGMREHPAGSNSNQYSTYFGFGRQFWCADFVAFCFDRTGARQKQVPWGYPSAVENITAWGQRNHEIHSMPMRGDIFTRKNGKHTGIVISAQGSKFMTIEGNTYAPPGSPPG